MTITSNGAYQSWQRFNNHAKKLQGNTWQQDRPNGMSKAQYRKTLEQLKHNLDRLMEYENDK